ncbi:hypothetical protein AKJ16_DCAP11213 [Drosera capensis]
MIEKVDLKDRETYEGLFREYWEIINETEGFTLEDLHSADARLRKGEKKKSNSHLSDSDSDEYTMNGEKQEASSDDNGSEDHGSEDDEINEPARKANWSKASLKGHKGSTKIEFVGWASKSLLDFLTSIGKDTDKQLTQDDVESIIVKYVQENRLFHPEKKKKVVCDARLRSLLGRKLISVYKINDLLEAHFVENLELSEEDELEHGFEDDRENDSSPFDKRKWSSYKPCQRKESVTKKDQIKETKSGYFNAESSPTEISISRFASVVPKNIKLVYLKRSLVEEMLKHPESSECKVVGTFVRVKSATIDCKHSHQLQQVTGIERTSLDEIKMSVLLKVSNIPDDIPISMLSNDDFSEEECEDLRQRIKNGFLEKLTVVELEKKARSLHEDITKHWIAKELVLLKHWIDLANEKGWRSKLFEYLERREMLESPEEQSRLLKEVPKVIPEIIELSPTPEDSPHNDGLENLSAQEATIEQRLEIPSSQDTKASFTIDTGDEDVSRSFISKIVNASLNGSIGKEKEANGAIAAQNEKKVLGYRRLTQLHGFANNDGYRKLGSDLQGQVERKMKKMFAPDRTWNLNFMATIDHSHLAMQKD